MDNGPIWPHHGEAYERSFQEAKQLYDEWEQRTVRKQGITVFTRKKTETDDDADI